MAVWVAGVTARVDGDHKEKKDPLDRVEDTRWLARFHAGDNAVLTQVYSSCYDVVDGVARRFFSSADAEPISAEVFFRMVSDAGFRANFAGGSLRAWFSTVARNHCITAWRKRQKEVLVDEPPEHAAAEDWSDRADARKLLEQLRAVVPPALAPLFEARFVEGLSERDAAAKLGTARMTLKYREGKLRRFIARVLREPLP